MHLHRIPGLDEEYLYFNDDMFPVGDCRPEDFFRDGKTVIGYYRHFFASGMYKKICRNSDRLARKALGMKSSCFFTRPQHICSPMLKSQCEELYDKVEDEMNVPVPIDFIDMVKAKIRGDMYNLSNDDDLAAKWYGVYNARLEDFKMFVANIKEEVHG